MKKALTQLWRKAVTTGEKYPGRATAITTLPGDAAMLLSGVAYNNWGRILAGASGLAANSPLYFFGDKKQNQGDGAIQSSKEDDQDKGLGARLANHWKFWRYPWEFQATLNLVQTASMVALAGTDSVSYAGQQLDVQTMVSSDNVRYGEISCGVLATVGFTLFYIKEKAKTEAQKALDASEKGKNYLVREFNNVVRFGKNRVHDVKENGVGPRGLKALWQNTVDDVARMGPNKAAATLFQIALIPYAVEGVYYKDWHVVGGCVLYGFANYFLGKTSKRIHEEPALAKPQMAVPS